MEACRRISYLFQAKGGFRPSNFHDWFRWLSFDTEFSKKFDEEMMSRPDNYEYKIQKNI